MDHNKIKIIATSAEQSDVTKAQLKLRGYTVSSKTCSKGILDGSNLTGGHLDIFENGEKGITILIATK
ncbi:MAG: hypothetical protein KKC46_01930 [Proteobacteria bacterium]|nr:hypothetical protein [Pseudomonadota bacterium]